MEARMRGALEQKIVRESLSSFAIGNTSIEQISAVLDREFSESKKSN
jgi:hypothetical protein